MAYFPDIIIILLFIQGFRHLIFVIFNSGCPLSANSLNAATIKNYLTRLSRLSLYKSEAPTLLKFLHILDLLPDKATYSDLALAFQETPIS